MSAEPDGPEDRLRRFATIWSRAVFPVTSTSSTRPEFEERLLPLARLLSEALRARSFDADAGRTAGAALVEAHCTDPEALSRTLDCVDAYLVLYCGEDGDREDLRARSARLQHAMAAGFAQALRERTLAEQEAVARAALEAQGVVAQALHATEARFRAVFEGAAIGIGIADLEGNILQVNGALRRMFGLSEQALRSRKVKEWVHPDDAPQTWRLYDELVSGEREHYHLEKAFYRPDGTVLWTNLTVSLLRDADGDPQYQLALMEDTTERRLLNLRLRYEATHDALTGLPNRAFFFERLEKALGAGEGQRFGLCYLDLDGFKTVNDSLGHAAGDRLLVEVADRLQACATASGEMVARLGGDEFVALTTGPDTERTVDELAARIMNALLAPISVDGRELTVRGSIGVVEGPAGGTQRGGGAAQRRHHHVPGQVGGRQPVRARRPGGRRPRHHPARAHHGAADGPGPGRVLHRVPAAGAPRRRQCAGRGGTGALAAPAARGAVPGPVHPARRAHRADRSAGPLGAGAVGAPGP
ncbi:diguanylate cyclase (GGDEF)-like protein/PAS domain S-box-containing protein [Streptomyces sp. SAI-229]